jgi:endoglucanase
LVERIRGEIIRQVHFIIKSNHMKNLVFMFAIASIWLTSCGPKPQIETAQPESLSSFSLHRGTNIAHWLSQSDTRGEERKTFFTQRDIAFIDSVGFDHIRLPIDEQQMWDENGKRNEDAFALLNDALSWCSDAGIRVIVDLHILRSHHFDAAKKPLWTDPREQEKLIGFWKDLSSFIRKWPNGLVAYEFMNEPVADDAEQWNVLLSRVADSIRSWEPERVMVIGSNRWQSANTFDKLRVPPNDRNIVLSFHFYEPFHLTHYKGSWTKLKDFQGEVHYPGQIVSNGKNDEERRVYNIDSLEKMMAKPIKLAASLDLPLYCGEFGVIDNAPVADKLRWYQDMVAIFERNKIGYANWNYKSGSFGIVDEQIKPDSAMVKILTGK